MDFDEYWEQENHLLELSYKESVRQLGERRVKKKEDMGKSFKQEKPNALDEFWEKLGDKAKKYVRSYRPDKRTIQNTKTDG